MSTSVGAGAGVRMTKVEFLAGWLRLGLGDPPALLQLGGIAGPTLDDRDRCIDDLVARLTERGLADGHAPVGWLAHHLHVLAGADHQLDIRFTGPAEPVVALGGATGRHGAMVVDLGAGRLELRSGDATRIVPTLLGLLGPIRAGRGVPVNIPADLLEQAAAAVPDGDLWALAERLRHHGVDRAQAGSLARMCSGITLGGQLGATATRYAAPRRAGWVVGFHRTGAGYVMNLRRGGVVTLCPTDGARLARHWLELAASLPPPPARGALATARMP